MRKQNPFNPEVAATEEVQGEIAEPIGGPSCLPIT